MKIEIGESLIYSYLRHEKKCLVTQVNWKASGNWEIHEDIRDRVIYEFDKINKHHAFSDIFKSDLNQTIKQAEIDVLGIDKDNTIYAFEIAFHENGLQYGGKIETRNRVFKKLLRGYITLKCYFPNSIHNLAFCSPKVNPATEKYIQDYFEILQHEFRTEKVNFFYYSNNIFNSEIYRKTISKTLNEADSSEIFVRSIKLLNITNKFAPQEHNHSEINELPKQYHLEDKQHNNSIEQCDYVKIRDFSIPTNKKSSETVQDYIKKIMHILLDNNLIPEDEMLKIQDKEYCKKTFMLQFPLITPTVNGYKDHTGRGRYWSKEIFGDKYYVCSQWWKDHHPTYLIKLKDWLLKLT